MEDEEREDLGIPGCRRLQQEWENGELATWNGSTERGGERRLIYLRHRKMWRHQEYVNDCYYFINKLDGPGWETARSEHEAKHNEWHPHLTQLTSNRPPAQRPSQCRVLVRTSWPLERTGQFDENTNNNNNNNNNSNNNINNTNINNK